MTVPRLIAAALVLLVAGAALLAVPAAQDRLFRSLAGQVISATPEPPGGLRVVVCGSASPLGNSPDRAQACIAVLTPDHFLLFDVGAGAPVRINQARLPLQRLDGVFLTHFHSDHITGLPDVNLASWVQGRPAPMAVYGPAGVAQVVAGYNTAFAMDRQYRTAHHGAALLPPANGLMEAHPFAESGIVYKNGDLRVTAFAVAHPPIEPAVGYRVDWRGRSVVISGDSNSAASLWSAAEGADLVLHDALAKPLLDPMQAAAEAAGATRLATIMQDIRDYHAHTDTLETAAEQAGVRQLALYHLVPAPPNALAMALFRRGLRDSTLVVDDLHTFDLPAHSTELVITAP